MPATSVSLDPTRLSRLVSLGYESPVLFDSGNGTDDRAREKEAWRLFAREAAEAFGCQLALVEHYAPTRPERAFIAAGGLDGFEEAFSSARSRNAEDDFLSPMLHRPGGSVHLGTEFVAPDRMHRSSSYSALAMPWHLEHFLMASVLTGGGSGVFFSLARTAREYPFVEGDKDLVASLLLSHLTRSMAVQREAAFIRGANPVLASVMYQAPTGLVIFDGQGKPDFINQKAAAIFAANDGLTLINGELRAEGPLAQAQLKQALSTILQVVHGQLLPAPRNVLVARRTGAPPYRVSFSTLSPLGVSANFSPSACAVAVINEEGLGRDRTVPALFRATYGLTRAEIRLCESLVAGQSLAEAAMGLGVSRNTAKTHLTRIFDKTGVRSQMALLRLLALGGRH